MVCVFCRVGIFDNNRIQCTYEAGCALGVDKKLEVYDVINLDISCQLLDLLRILRIAFMT